MKQEYMDWRDRMCLYKYIREDVKKIIFQDEEKVNRCYKCRGYGQYLTKSNIILDCEYYKPIGKIRVHYAER